MSDKQTLLSLAVAAIVLLQFFYLLAGPVDGVDDANSASTTSANMSLWSGSSTDKNAKQLPISLTDSNTRQTKPAVVLRPAPIPVPDAFDTALADRLRDSMRDRQTRPWQSIVFHHSATTKGDMKAFDNYHRSHFGDPNGIKYHFVIGNGSYSEDGEIEITPRWERQIAAAHNHFPENAPNSLAINFVGNFEEGVPTESQLREAVRLAKILCQHYQIPIEKVLTHTIVDNGGTLCPGSQFPYEAIRNRIQKALLETDPAPAWPKNKSMK